MGTAGLDLSLLTKLLRRKKIDCTLLQDDVAQDHCLLRLTGPGPSKRVVLIEYINQGFEPRVTLAKMKLLDAPNGEGSGARFSIPEESIRLRGARKGDPQKIVDFVEPLFAK